MSKSVNCTHTHTHTYLVHPWKIIVDSSLFCKLDNHALILLFLKNLTPHKQRVDEGTFLSIKVFYLINEGILEYYNFSIPNY